MHVPQLAQRLLSAAALALLLTGPAPYARADACAYASVSGGAGNDWAVAIAGGGICTPSPPPPTPKPPEPKPPEPKP
ncbi:hypothetical protein ACFVYD_06465, partial [Streptomyces sp. NPDC058301]